jgi:hypothetical protein
VGPQRILAPWLSDPSATPPDRWFGEYHSREATAPEIARAFQALRIPPNHVRIFNRDLDDGSPASPEENPFHTSTVLDTGYAEDWRAMFGSP